MAQLAEQTVANRGLGHAEVSVMRQVVGTLVAFALATVHPLVDV